MIDFNDSKSAFKDKSDFDLNRAFFLFQTLNYPKISKFLTIILKVILSLRIPINYLIKLTIFKQFCGGETILESRKTIDKLWKSSIGTILDYSAEGQENEDDFKDVYEETLKVLDIAKNNPKIPFVVFKLTGLIQFNILKKLSAKEELSKEENSSLMELNKRLNTICNKAKDISKPIFIDAEESWIQNGIDDLVFSLMKQFNKEKVLIFNTVQMYRNDRLAYLKNISQIAQSEGFKIGLKIVRGAYHEKEIKRALEKGYNIPVHEKKSNTDKDFNNALKFCIENINHISICSGTHNLESSIYLLKLMKEHSIKNNDDRIYSSQLLGMSDNISYNLSNANYNVSKYVPYGPVKKVIPYLIRRAEENRSISGQMGRELKNIIEEKKRRKAS
ncbi:MAG: proline dehydrogenase family protein [Flavobacteriales bacterium]|nr:proline dehydrogenase family protein [Flavobacteriales bacterium]